MSASLLCLVIAVSDGDSLSVRCGAHQPERVRVAVIDAPELRQPFGTRSRENLDRLCYRQKARLYVLGHDTYGRTLANVYCGGQNIAVSQVRAGLAWVYAPRTGQHPQLTAMQLHARAEHRGLWEQKHPTPPWVYRQQHQQHQHQQPRHIHHA
jgi:endonuclease YncB( thermonuclease family)